MLDAPPNIEIDYATEKELITVAALDNEEYGEATVDHAGLLSWWRQYPKGVIVVRDNDSQQLLAIFGIWPLRESTFQQLVNGETDEQYLTSRDVVLDRGSVGQSFWYVGGVMIAKEFRMNDRSHRMHSQLFRGILEKWLYGLEKDQVIEICALAASGLGASMARKLGFITNGVQSSKSQCRVYYLTGRPQEMIDAIELKYGVSTQV